MLKSTLRNYKHAFQQLCSSYSYLQNVPLQLDVYPPSSPSAGSTVASSGGVPCVLWWHGGGLTFANRSNFFPKWLQTRVNNDGIAFISADYRLIPTGSVTAHEVIEDVKDAFAFLRGDSFSYALDALAAEGRLPFPKFRVDPRGIATAGSSAGGTCAYFAAMHVDPKPAAILSLFATGGDCLNPHYFVPKTSPFMSGRPLLDPTQSQAYLYPLSPSVSSDIVADSPLAPANPRAPLALLYLQLGTYLDYYTGQHEPSLSQALREAHSATHYPDFEAKRQKLRSLIPVKHLSIFPQFGVDSSWPPTLLIHGSDDTAVPVAESENMYQTLQKAGVLSRITIVEGQDHFFDQNPEAEKLHKEVLDDAAGFLKRRLRNATAATTPRDIVPVTMTYKTVDSRVPIKMDVYPPAQTGKRSRSPSDSSAEVGALLWFHARSSTVGTDFLPKWLQRRVGHLGIAFVSVDYRLPSSGTVTVTAHDIIEDIRDAFAFLRGTGFNSALEYMAVQGLVPFEKFRIDPRGIAVAGSSVGGTAAYLAAMHVDPKPVALLNIFAMGGDYLTPRYYSPSSGSETSKTVIDPPRMPPALLALQLGNYLDYYTGQHEPSLSAALRAAAAEGNSSDPDTKSKSKLQILLASGLRTISEVAKPNKGPHSDVSNPLRSVIPPNHLGLFPQFNIDAASWPPTLLIHGSKDTFVPVSESEKMYGLLQEAGVLSRMTIIEGEDHFFDLTLGRTGGGSPQAAGEKERKFEKVFDDAAGFLNRRISLARETGRRRSRSRSQSRRRS